MKIAHPARTMSAALARANGENLEAAARRARYDWLAEVARDARACVGSPRATPPTTRPRRCCTACCAAPACKGCAASRPGASWTPGVELVRPLLRGDARRRAGLPRRAGADVTAQDSTNADLRFTRNRIRHELLPLLAEHYNPGIAAVLARLAEQAGEVFRDEERRQPTAAARTRSCPRAGRLLVFDRRRLAAARPATGPGGVPAACGGGRAGRWAAWALPPGSAWRPWRAAEAAGCRPAGRRPRPVRGSAWCRWRRA